MSQPPPPPPAPIIRPSLMTKKRPHQSSLMQQHQQQKQQEKILLSAETDEVAGEEIRVKPEPKDVEKAQLPSAREITTSKHHQPAPRTALDILDEAITNTAAAAANSRANTPRATPHNTMLAAAAAAPTVLSASERATQRTSIDEKKLYADYYSQSMHWVALARIAQNYIATAVNAETAVDLARAEETQFAKQ
jgi:hypothetical protein